MTEEIKVTLPQAIQLAIVSREWGNGEISEDSARKRMKDILGEDLYNQILKNEKNDVNTAIVLKPKDEMSIEETESLGYEGLLQIGYSPQEAVNEIAQRLDDSTLELLRDLPPETLENFAANWKEKGLTPPWEGKL